MKRLIYAEDAMQNVMDEIRYKESLYTSTVYSIAKKAIGSAPTVDQRCLRPVEEWISVKEMLPDSYEKVFVRLDHWSGVDTYLAFYDPDRGWCDCGGYFDDGTNNDGEPLTYETAGVNVTHWMPLPKLPKTETESRKAEQNA